MSATDIRQLLTKRCRFARVEDVTSTVSPPEPAIESAIDPAPRPRDTGRRSRKKQATRDRLLAAAHELFASKGYDETTTFDVAEAADVAQRTLFRHFPSKESLLYADMEDATFLLRDALASRPAQETTLQAVRHALFALRDDFEAHRELRLLQARLAATSPAVSGHFRAVVQANWERELIAAVAQRLGVDPMQDPRPEILAGAAMSACRVATRQWTVNDGRSDYMEHLDQALAAIPELTDLA